MFVYGFKGVFLGEAEYEYRFPEEGKLLKCIVFISQPEASLDFDAAKKEISKYGFAKFQDLEGNQLKVESLNAGGGAKFQPYYEEALDQGSSIAIY